jgi:hypothetical protein
LRKLFPIIFRLDPGAFIKLLPWGGAFSCNGGSWRFVLIYKALCHLLLSKSKTVRYPLPMRVAILTTENGAQVLVVRWAPCFTSPEKPFNKEAHV